MNAIVLKMWDIFKPTCFSLNFYIWYTVVQLPALVLLLAVGVANTF